MIVYLNGHFLPEEQATISIHDRGFLYGDGLFESIRIYDREPFLWSDHMTRFRHGCKVLALRSPVNDDEMLALVRETLRLNALDDGLVRITLSRGRGPRGYSPRGANSPTLLIAPFRLPSLPPTYDVIVSSVRLPEEDPIADFKHLNKLHQVVARAEADAAGVHEALLTNTEGCVVEGTTTNVFWVQDGGVCTPPVRGILAGTTRAHILRLCAKLNLPSTETHIHADALSHADGLFVTSCAAEIMEVTRVNGTEMKRSPLTLRLKSSYRST